jgi:hypothetical protein
MIPGPDIEMAAMAEALNRIAARNQVVLNFASNSGDSIARLSRAGRVLVTASSPGQVNDSDFAEFFLQALETGAGDDGSSPADGVKDRPQSLLATYNWAVLHTAEWIVRQRLAPSADPTQPRGHTPGWIVEGKQSAEIFKKLYSGPDVPAERSFVPSPESEQPDAAVQSLVANNEEWWSGRRSITEMPVLEDLGPGKAAAAGKGSSALGVKGYRPLKGTAPTETGFLARQIVLGNPQLLPAEIEKGEKDGSGEKEKK